MIIIEHEFKDKGQNLVALFEGVNSMEDLVRNIQQQALLVHDVNYETNDFMGDAFELFVEMFLKILSFDKRVMVRNYKPIPSVEDNGCDGIGENFIGEKCVVQIKFRTNPSYELTGNIDHLTNMINEGVFLGVVYNLNDDEHYRHIVFTTADGLHYKTRDNTFKGKVKCVGIKQFNKIIGRDNIPFWNKCRELVMELDPRLQQVV